MSMAYDDVPLQQQLSLVDAYPDLVLPALERDATLQERFEAFAKANPHVYVELRRRALTLARRGVKRVGVKALVESMRYDAAVSRGDDGYALNNSLTSRFARMLVDSEPELAGLIELRELKS